MELDKIIEIRKNIGIQIQDSLNLVGTNELKILCDMANLNDQLIKRLKNPTEALIEDKKFKRLMNGN